MKTKNFTLVIVITFFIISCFSCNKNETSSNKESLQSSSLKETSSVYDRNKSTDSNNDLIGLWEGTYNDDKDLQTKSKKLKAFQKEMLDEISKEFQVAFKENNEFDIMMLGQLDNGIYDFDEKNNLIKLKSIHGDLEIHKEGDKLWWELPDNDKITLHKISDDYTKIRKGKSGGTFQNLTDGMPFGIYNKWEFIDLLPESGGSHNGIDLIKSLEMGSLLTFKEDKSFTKTRNDVINNGTYRTDSESIYIKMESGKSETYKVISVTFNELKLHDAELNATRVYKRVE